MFEPLYCERMTQNTPHIEKNTGFLCWSSFRFSDQRDQQVLSLSIAKLEMQKKAVFVKSLMFSKPLYCEPVFSSHIGQYQRIHTEASKFIGIL